MKLYLYCLCEPAAHVELHDTVGLDQSKPVVIDFPIARAVVSPGLEEPIERSAENMLGHDRVVQAVLEVSTPLPFRFGALVEGSALEEFVNRRSSAISELFGRLQGCVEMNIKILGPELEHPIEPTAPSGGPGTEFLMLKKQAFDRQDQAGKLLDQISAWLAESTDGLIRDSAVRKHTEARPLLAAAHLVERSGLQEYRTRFKQLQLERPDLRLLISGPWAPYSFCNLES